jgi:hypothetical protein
MGCCRKNTRLQRTKAKFKKAPQTLENGAIKFSRPPNQDITGFTADTADPTVLRPEHPPCKHFLAQAVLEQDGSASVLAMCMCPESAFQGRTPSPSDCRDCPSRVVK